MKTKVLITAAGLLLAACGTNKATLSPTMVTEQALYKKTVYFDSKNKDLQAHLETLLHTHPSLSYSQEPAFSTLSFTLKQSNKRSMVFNSGPKLTGILRKERKPASLALHYTLSSFSGTVLAEGEVLGTGQTRERFAPSLIKDAPIPAEVIADVAYQLIQVAEQQERALPWQAVVVGQKDAQHITINAGEAEGLKIATYFQTATHPAARLQVVTFEESPQGESRAVLRLLEGELPSTGRMIQPEIKK